jgi:hypothetical protein
MPTAAVGSDLQQGQVTPTEPQALTAGRADRWRSTVSRLFRGRSADLLVYLVYLVAGLVVTSRLWVNLPRRVVAANPGDQTQFEWWLSHGARVITHGQNPFFSTRMNVPDGINMMANTSVLGLTLPLSPVTILFGVNAAFALLVALALASTSSTWYWVLSRQVRLAGPDGVPVMRRLPAFVAAAFCGFAPGLISHAAGQPNFVAQFLLPLIAWRLAKLGEPGRSVRNGLILAVLLIWQIFINEELLLFTAAAVVVFVAVLAVARRGEVRRYVRPVAYGLAVAGVTTLVVCAYPLWYQFFGPQRYHGLPFDPSAYSTDPATYFAFSRESVAGAGGVVPRFVLSATEENGFFGFPFMIFMAILVAWLWRRYLAVRAAAITAVIFALLAMGDRINLHGVKTGIPGPYALISWLPVVNLVTPTRLTLLMIPLFGLIMAIGLAEAMRVAPARSAPQARARWRAVWILVVVAALLPAAPTPITAKNRPAVPAFITDGTWKRYVPADKTLVPVPLSASYQPEGMWWSATTLQDFAIPRGYFLGPTGPHDRQAIFGAPPRPTSNLLRQVADSGKVPVVNDQDRANAQADLLYWRAAIVVLQPGPSEEALWKTTSQLLGAEPRWVDGVWLWVVG